MAEKKDELFNTLVLVLGNATHFPEVELRLSSLAEDDDASVDRCIRMLDYLEDFLDDLSSIEDEYNHQPSWTGKLRRFIRKFRTFVEPFEGEDEESFLLALDAWIENNTTSTD